MTNDPVTAYINERAARLTADGCTVNTEHWNGVPVLVGHRADFKLRWMATRLHLFTVVSPAPAVDAATMEGFTNTAMDLALQRKGQMRGFQSGVAVLPCLVSTAVDPGALAWAQDKQRVRFACMARPVVADVARGQVGFFQGNAALGLIYSAHLRRKLDLYFTLTPAQR